MCECFARLNSVDGARSEKVFGWELCLVVDVVLCGHLKERPEEDGDDVEVLARDIFLGVIGISRSKFRTMHDMDYL